MRSEAEAPVTGPRREQAVEPRRVRQGLMATCRRRAASCCASCLGEIVGARGPERSRQLTLLEPSAGLLEPDAGTVRRGRVALMPQRDVLLPWLSASYNAGRRWRVAGAGRARARERAHAHFGRSSASRASRPLCRALGGMRQRAALGGCCRPAAPCSASTSRSARSTRHPAAAQRGLAERAGARARTVLAVSTTSRGHPARRRMSSRSAAAGTESWSRSTSGRRGRGERDDVVVVARASVRRSARRA